jgi:hypothetical protein
VCCMLGMFGWLAGWLAAWVIDFGVVFTVWICCLCVIDGTEDRVTLMEGSQLLYEGASSSDRAIKLYDGRLSKREMESAGEMSEKMTRSSCDTKSHTGRRARTNTTHRGE